jgi:hypothetical protein
MENRSLAVNSWVGQLGYMRHIEYGGIAAKNLIPFYNIPPVVLHLIDRTIGTTITSAADISMILSASLPMTFYI